MATTSNQALVAIKREVDGFGPGDVAAARQLFDVADSLANIRELAGDLAARGVDAANKSALVQRAFPGLEAGAKRVLDTAVAQRWDSADEFTAAVQEAAIRAVAQATSNHAQLVSELNSFSDTVTSNGELELTIGSRLGSSEAKVQLVERLFGNRLGEDSLRILRSLVRNPGGHRPRRFVQRAIAAVADQANRQVATVTTARPLGASQLERLEAGLSARFGRTVAINQVIDPSVIGGVRVELGDEVIDDTAAARIHDLRLQLA